MAFQPIRRILPSAIQHAGIEREVKAQRVLEMTRTVLQRLWGEEKSSYLEVISYSEGVVRLRSKSSVALQELRAWEPRLLNEVNHQLGERLVKTFQAMC